MLRELPKDLFSKFFCQYYCIIAILYKHCFKKTTDDLKWGALACIIIKCWLLSYSIWIISLRYIKMWCLSHCLRPLLEFTILLFHSTDMLREIGKRMHWIWAQKLLDYWAISLCAHQNISLCSKHCCCLQWHYCAVMAMLAKDASKNIYFWFIGMCFVQWV